MIRFALALTLLAANAPLALAQHMGSPQEQSACTRDAQRLCRKNLGDDNAVQGCLQLNRAKLGASCRRVFESHGM
jgi:hypothetical protein